MEDKSLYRFFYIMQSKTYFDNSITKLLIISEFVIKYIQIKQLTCLIQGAHTQRLKITIAMLHILYLLKC